MSLIFKTDYATKPWPWGFQSPAGKTGFAKDTDGSTYMVQECDPNLNWVDGTERADAIDQAHAMSPYLVEGSEVAFDYEQTLMPGWSASNPGWCVVGIELHDPAGKTQSPIECLPTQLGEQIRCFGGAIGAGGAPVNAADRYYTPEYQLVIGQKHRKTVGIVLSSDRTKGSISFALDGKVLVSRHPCATLYTDGSAYLKLANYRDPSGETAKNIVHSWDLAAYAGAGAFEEALGGVVTPPAPTVDPVAALADVRAAIAELELTDAWKTYGKVPTSHTFKTHAELVAARTALGG